MVGMTEEGNPEFVEGTLYKYSWRGHILHRIAWNHICTHVNIYGKYDMISMIYNSHKEELIRVLSHRQPSKKDSKSLCFVSCIWNRFGLLITLVVKRLVEFKHPVEQASEQRLASVLIFVPIHILQISINTSSNFI